MRSRGAREGFSWLTASEEENHPKRVQHRSLFGIVRLKGGHWGRLPRTGVANGLGNSTSRWALAHGFRVRTGR